MSDTSLSAKERIDVVLKEYESTRKELEEDIRYLSTVGVTVGLGVAAGIWGMRDQINVSLILLFVPLTLLLLQTMKQHHLVNAMESGRDIAKIEDRVFRIAGEPLLLHETRLVALRASHRPWLGPVFAVATVAAYLGASYWLFTDLDVPIKNSWHRLHALHRWIIIALFVFLAGWNVRCAIWRFRTETAPFRSDLLDLIHKTSVPENAAAPNQSSLG